ncbi:ribosome small subunit-dependent GTPase A [Mechercharimyces sp. CAU 1602]|uniref:ribosome small subunit-dependent GTPase A n=1 Tax=Mechercharimyces sp. CAU 1602 TaxID=2973933 RepID=UPI00216217AA|nr:ribosome small subunit-dependent GTPase A [Mechercharimyces sp. CAU 1602]MCS1351073.1 ribosome small subunit-dependent GTPase A [Mechercharimyces sp. CAU 1602]
MVIEKLGWNQSWENIRSELGLGERAVGRVALEHKHLYRVWTQEGEVLAHVSGSMRYKAEGREAYPAVGDWVALDIHPEEEKGYIHAILPRKSHFSRKVAGNVTEEQIVAANVDTIFLVQALDEDFHVRRLERYLIAAWDSGASPVIILSKADCGENVDEKVMKVEAAAMGVPIHVISAQRDQGLEELLPYLEEGHTIALTGSSGVGKSTLINWLYGAELLRTGATREQDGKGRHTSTHREMVLLPQGGVLIDTPGMRELQLWDGDEGLSTTFQDVEQLAIGCTFRDCTHQQEPGCAVQTAIATDEFSRERLDHYHKMLREAAYIKAKKDKRLQKEQKQALIRQVKRGKKSPKRR